MNCVLLTYIWESARRFAELMLKESNRCTGGSLISVLVGTSIMITVTSIAGKYFLFANDSISQQQKQLAVTQLQTQLDSLFNSSIDHLRLSIQRLDRKGYLRKCLANADKGKVVSQCQTNTVYPFEVRHPATEQVLVGTKERPTAYTSKGMPCRDSIGTCAVFVHGDFVAGCLEQAPGSCLTPEVLVFRVYLSTKAGIKRELKHLKKITYLKKIGKVDDSVAGTMVCGDSLDSVADSSKAKELGKAIKGFKNGKIQCI